MVSLSAAQPFLSSLHFGTATKKKKSQQKAFLIDAPPGTVEVLAETQLRAWSGS